ncbi:MAG: cytochrome B5 [Candidatus Zixiibacteriota bacterium]|nr:MAG: cytochrome B5 [candidate division Zixibacteria bacterium]
MAGARRLREFTEAELRRFNGRGGAPAYIAFRGKVYDVTRSYHWQRGEHWASHSAGEDLTDALDGAPHGEGLLSRCPQIGVLSDRRR